MFPPGRGRCRLCGMKTLALFAILAALGLGAYAAVDFWQNQREQTVFADASQLELAQGLHQVADEDSRKADGLQSAERGDALLGAVSLCALIGAIAMFSQSRKSETVAA